MSKKRARPRTGNAAPDMYAARVLELPNEVLLEIWDELGPMERVCVSQVCSDWRRIALGIPRFWAQIAFVQTKLTDRAPRCRRSILCPAPGSSNLSFLKTALVRSGDFPLDVTISTEGHPASPQEDFCTIIAPHAYRIARMHASYAYLFHGLLNICPDWPALRTLTAGFDDRASIVFVDLPPRSVHGAAFPALRQMHFSSTTSPEFLFGKWTFTSLVELSFAPIDIQDILLALVACPHLSSIILVLTHFRQRTSSNLLSSPEYSTFLERMHRLRLSICDIAGDRERSVLEMLDNERFLDVTLDYQGRSRMSGPKTYRALVSPCSPLEDPLHVNLVVREGMYQLVVTDGAQRRRAVLLDASSIARTRGLWDCYIRNKVVHSATVDALAWQYFINDVPEHCAVSTLTITVGYKHTEVKGVSLARLPHLTKLCIETLKPAINFPPRVVKSLVRSRPSASQPLAVLSLAGNCDFGAESDLAKLADVIERPAG